MSGLLAKYSACSPFILATIFFITAVVVFFWLYAKKRSTFWTIVITSIFVVIFIFTFGKFISPKIKSMLGGKKTPPASFVYDTDPRNDAFIKGTLKKEKQKKLDAILMIEKKECGLRLSNQQLYEYTKYENDIIEAYNRWRKCKEMRRSYHHVIYPDERKLYHK